MVAVVAPPTMLDVDFEVDADVVVLIDVVVVDVVVVDNIKMQVLLSVARTNPLEQLQCDAPGPSFMQVCMHPPLAKAQLLTATQV